jgi:hypothetical protein
MQHPSLVRRLFLVCTGPCAGQPAQDPRIEQHAQAPDPSLHDFLYLFFGPSYSSRTASRSFWERRHIRKKDADPPTSQQTMNAQLAALNEWMQIKGERLAELKSNVQPTLVVNGSNDIMVPTINSSSSLNISRMHSWLSIPILVTHRCFNIRVNAIPCTYIPWLTWRAQEREIRAEPLRVLASLLLDFCSLKYSFYSIYITIIFYSKLR